MPELSTPPRRSSARAHTRLMSSARNGSSVRVTRTPPRVTDSVCRRAGPWRACAAGSPCPAGSTCAPWGQGPAPGREKRPPLPGGRFWMCCTRTSHRLIGGATTAACWFAPWEPTARRAAAPPGQPRAKITVTVTLSCWVPGWTGTEGAWLALGTAAYGSGWNGCAGCASDMLTTAPKGRLRARAYAPALAFASATALTRAVASSVLVSDRLSDTPLITVAFPPARAAALIWLPATGRRRSVIVSCSLTWYPLGTP